MPACVCAGAAALLVQVMTAGLDEVPPVPPDPAECFTAAEALLPGKVPQRKPGELQVMMHFTANLQVTSQACIQCKHS